MKKVKERSASSKKWSESSHSMMKETATQSNFWNDRNGDNGNQIIFNNKLNDIKNIWQFCFVNLYFVAKNAKDYFLSFTQFLQHITIFIPSISKKKAWNICKTSGILVTRLKIVVYELVWNDLDELDHDGSNSWICQTPGTALDLILDLGQVQFPEMHSF